MIDLKYIGGDGEVVSLNDRTVVSGTPLSLLSSEWGYKVSDGGVLSGVKRQPHTVEVSTAFVSTAEADAACNVLDEDMAKGRVGELHFGEWSQRTVVTKVATPRLRGGSVTVKLTLLLLDGVWRRYRDIVLEAGSADDLVTTGLDYPTDYPFDYAGSARSTSASSVTSGGARVIAIFFGPCTNPYVRVGSNVYGVNASAGVNERIVIDPTKRKEVGSSVYCVGAYGERTNLYSKRRRGASGSGSYVFEQLPKGTFDISWPQSYNVTLRLVEERGNLPWS